MFSFPCACCDAVCTLGSSVSPKECIPKQAEQHFVQYYEQKSQDELVQKRTARAVCLASASDQAELMNQMPQHNGMWIRRGALGAIDLSRKSMQPTRRMGMPCAMY